MKKLAIILIISFAFILPLRVGAQSANWVALQSDVTSLNAPGQKLNLSLTAMLNTAVSGASLILHYDPACFKIAGYQPGSLLPGATAFNQEQPGQLDLTYYFQGKGKGLTGEGSLITIQLETLQVCTSDVSVAPGTITLGVLDDQGLAFNLPGVEFRSLLVHMAAASSLALVTPQPADATLPANNSSVVVVPPPSISLGPNVFWIILAIAASMLFGLIFITAIFFLLHSRSPRSKKNAIIQGPALMHTGGTVLLQRERAQLGRHIEIIHQNGEFYVVDTGSRLGVFINGARLGSGYYHLSHGDLVQLGREISYKFINARRGSPQQR
jgi:hypothetical protein